ncbi:uncharacterized protein MONBRDRAFT_14147, partial [Monosiga brevicollis MX1]
EGDKRAFYESSQREMNDNRAEITRLRKENKTMAAQLKQLKKPAVAHRASGPVALTQGEIQTVVKKRNTLRHQIKQAKAKHEAQLKVLRELEVEGDFVNNEGGAASSEMQQIRRLENNLDKANIKAQEAQHIKQTYLKIIDQLQKDRLQFDQTISGLEKTLEGRKQELAQLEAMCQDACAARDAARNALAQKEIELADQRKARETEKAQLSAQVEERRRQYEAMEKRLRMASASQNRKNAGGYLSDTDSSKTQERLMTYEEAMARIRDATGASDVHEVVQRFMNQEESQRHLQKLQQENQAKLAELREEHARKQKQFEALKYSGEARNTGNQRILNEFENHLNAAQTRHRGAKETSDRLNKTLVALTAGIDALYAKLGVLKPVKFRAANNVMDKLVESQLRLKTLHEELASRKTELPDGLQGESIPRILPQHNTRVNLNDTVDEEEDEFDDDEFMSRDAIKRQAQTVVEAKADKKRVI